MGIQLGPNPLHDASEQAPVTWAPPSFRATGEGRQVNTVPKRLGIYLPPESFQHKHMTRCLKSVLYNLSKDNQRGGIFNLYLPQPISRRFG